MGQNIEMFTYCSPQTSHPTGNTYFIFIKTQLCLEMRTNFLPSAIIIKALTQPPNKTAR